MLCNTCKNKQICKHYEYFKNISINLTIQLERCELYSNNQQAAPPTSIQDKKPIYRQPLPSTIQEEVDILEEDEERVVIDLSNYKDEPDSLSIVDLVMKGDLTDDQ